MAAQKATLLSNGSATGNWVPWNGGRASLLLIGTIGGATVKLQLLAQDNATAVDVATVSAVGKNEYDLPQGSYRLSISGGTPSAIYADLLSIVFN